MNLTSIRDRVAVDSVRWAPKRLYSGAIGVGARARLPRPFRAPVYRAFARWVGASLDEVELPLDRYPSLGCFFARRLRADARELNVLDEDVVISPCDGRVAAIGVVTDGHLIQAKGRSYEMSTLLAESEVVSELAGADYLTVYLSPRDYHRVHCPVDAEFIGYDFVPGRLFPVNPFFSGRVQNLLAANERIVLHFTGRFGRMALVMVGAVGVGNITLARPALETRELRGRRSIRRVRFDEPLAFSRGDEIGAFRLGSTVVALFERGRVTGGALQVDDPLRVGQPVARAVEQSGAEP